jgi:hypothetical protein
VSTDVHVLQDTKTLTTPHRELRALDPAGTPTGGKQEELSMGEGLRLTANGVGTGEQGATALAQVHLWEGDSQAVGELMVSGGVDAESAT